MIELTVPIRIVSESNRSAGQHWSVRHKRFVEQKQEIWWTWRATNRQPLPVPVVVTLTRIAPRRFDDDNLTSGFKATRDQIAELLGVDDGDPRVTWRYAQERGRPREYAVRIRIEAAA